MLATQRLAKVVLKLGDGLAPRARTSGDAPLPRRQRSVGRFD
ncbi:MAG TPA: hypothetical protein VGK69_02485 [Gaiellaceae bacterium]